MCLNDEKDSHSCSQVVETNAFEIKQGVERAFHHLLFDSGDWRPSINGISFKTLDR